MEKVKNIETKFKEKEEMCAFMFRAFHLNYNIAF